MADIKDSQRIEALTKLSHQMMTQYHERRNLEWRIHVLIWTLLSAFTYFSVTSKDVNVDICIFSFFIIVLVVLHARWTYMMQVGQASDQNQSKVYREEADALISGRPIPSIDEPHKDTSNWNKWCVYKQLRWAFVIIGKTVMMGLAAVVLMLSKA